MEKQQKMSNGVNKKMFPKLFGFGLLLFVITMILIFIMSMITGTADTEYPPAKYLWVGMVIAVLLAACSLWFSRRLHAASSIQALTFGLIWAIMVAAILLIIAIPNQTASAVFSHLGTYLIFIGIAVGPVLLKIKNIQ